MSEPWLLSEAQICRIKPCFPLSHGIPRVDGRRIVSGIIYVIRGGLMWRDAPKAYGPHKVICNRFIRWNRLGVFNRIFAQLATKAGEPATITIEAPHLKAHRTAASLLKGGDSRTGGAGLSGRWCRDLRGARCWRPAISMPGSSGRGRCRGQGPSCRSEDRSAQTSPGRRMGKGAPERRGPLRLEAAQDRQKLYRAVMP